MSEEVDALIRNIRTRRSIREYKKDERIPERDIEKILDAARYAPSPENMQMWRFVVIRDDDEIKKLIADISVEMAEAIFGKTAYELTQGRLWYLPDYRRPGTYETMRDGSLFRYPQFADTVIVGCASESFQDSSFVYPNWLFGSVVVGMAMLQMWLVGHHMGYGVAYQAFPFTDPRHVEVICNKLAIPRSWTPIAALCIGVPQEKRMLGPSRFPLEGVMYTERWGNPYTRVAFRKSKEESK